MTFCLALDAEMFPEETRSLSEAMRSKARREPVAW